MKELIECNIDVNVLDENGYTPLHLAAYQGHSEIVEMLLAHHNINPNYVTFKGQSSLFSSIIELDEIIGLDIVKLHNCDQSKIEQKSSNYTNIGVVE